MSTEHTYNFEKIPFYKRIYEAVKEAKILNVMQLAKIGHSFDERIRCQELNGLIDDLKNVWDLPNYYIVENKKGLFKTIMKKDNPTNRTSTLCSDSFEEQQLLSIQMFNKAPRDFAVFATRMLKDDTDE